MTLNNNVQFYDNKCRINKKKIYLYKFIYALKVKTMKYVLSLLLTACLFFSASAKSNEVGKDIDVNHYEIQLKNFDLAEKSIEASTTITLTAINDTDIIARTSFIDRHFCHFRRC